jgi:hypothetical protein
MLKNIFTHLFVFLFVFLYTGCGYLLLETDILSEETHNIQLEHTLVVTKEITNPTQYSIGFIISNNYSIDQNISFPGYSTPLAYKYTISNASGEILENVQVSLSIPLLYEITITGNSFFVHEDIVFVDDTQNHYPYTVNCLLEYYKNSEKIEVEITANIVQD